MKAEKSKKRKLLRFIILFLPLLIAILLLVYIRASREMQEASEFMSPVENATMITSLSVFILGYLCFLVLMFFDDIKLFFAKHKAVK